MKNGRIPFYGILPYIYSIVMRTGNNGLKFLYKNHNETGFCFNPQNIRIGNAIKAVPFKLK